MGCEDAMTIKIGVDIDGTIKYTQRAAVEVFNKELNQEVDIEDVRTFHLDELYNLDPKEGKRLWRKLEPKIYSLGVPRENAAPVLSQLVEAGHIVHFVTGRPGMPHLRRITEKWLRKHEFPFNGSNLHMSAQNKAKVAQKLALDLFFEDAPDHLDLLLAGEVPTVIVDAIYNQDYNPAVPRITNWQEVPAIIAALEKRKKSKKP